MNAIVQRPQPDWSQPVRWNSGESCHVVSEYTGFAIITLKRIPKALEPMIATLNDKRVIVVNTNDGSPVGWEKLEAWVENENAVSKGTQLWNSF